MSIDIAKQYGGIYTVILSHFQHSKDSKFYKRTDTTPYKVTV